MINVKKFYLRRRRVYKTIKLLASVKFEFGKKKWVEGDMNFTNYYCVQSLESSLSFHKI